MPKKKLKDLNFLTTNQLAIILKVKPHYLEQNRHRGGDNMIPFYKLGAKVRYEKSEVLEHLEKIHRRSYKGKAA